MNREQALLGMMRGNDLEIEPFCGHRSDAWTALVRGNEFRIVHGQTIIDDRQHGFYHQGQSWIRNVVYDLDYEVYVQAQVWRHDAEEGDGGKTWRYVVLWAPNTTDVELLYEWDHRPSFTEVGEFVDWHCKHRGFNQGTDGCATDG